MQKLYAENILLNQTSVVSYALSSHTVAIRILQYHKA